MGPPPSTNTTPPPTTTTTTPAITTSNTTTSTTMLLLLLVVVVAPLVMANPTGSYGDLETWRDSPILSGEDTSSEDYCRYACDGKGGCITTYTGAPSSPWQTEMGTSSSPSSSSSSSTSTSPPPPGHLHGWGGVGGV